MLDFSQEILFFSSALLLCSLYYWVHYLPYQSVSSIEMTFTLSLTEALWTWEGFSCRLTQYLRSGTEFQILNVHMALMRVTINAVKDYLRNKICNYHGDDLN